MHERSMTLPAEDSSGQRMAQCEPGGMKEKPTGLFGAILHVADHRMPSLGEMDAYLILPSGLEKNLHKRSTALHRKPPPFRPRELAVMRVGHA